MMCHTRRARALVVFALICNAILVLACGMSGTVASRSPRWACPSPTPLPYGEVGPVKEWSEHTVINPTTGIPETTSEPVYYEQWEREYGPDGVLLGAAPPYSGPPFPSPTPYGIVGTNYILGQRVEVWPLHVLVEARRSIPIVRPHIPAGTQRLYYVDLSWYNHSITPIPIDYAERVRIRSITAPNGAIVTDSTWSVSDLSRDVAGLVGPLPNTIPPGESRVSIPIIAPEGEVKTVDVVFMEHPNDNPLLPTPIPAPDQPTPTPMPTLTPTGAPTPNTDLRSTAPALLTVQWTKAQISIGPECGDVGVLTNWENSYGVAWGHEVPIGVAAPPGAYRVVQIALNQVGKRYVWGSKGAETFDCSGLMTWSYARININIPSGTAGQWPRMRSVSGAEVQPGDLIFFAIETPGRVDHVGMLIGDLDGDGAWDMVHASAPCCGVRIEYDVLNRAFWKNRVVGFRTAR